ncbi:hypothetical protein TNCV_4681341 [Trichonephila clavipes]|nr:hypothetical protein TNCV_4681341 [Trichonephila clavipes]
MTKSQLDDDSVDERGSAIEIRWRSLSLKKNSSAEVHRHLEEIFVMCEISVVFELKENILQWKFIDILVEKYGTSVTMMVFSARNLTKAEQMYKMKKKQSNTLHQVMYISGLLKKHLGSQHFRIG